MAADLSAGAITSSALVEECLDQMERDDATRETFLYIDRTDARAAAEAMDKLRSANAAPSPYAGIPISVKDLFDIAGQVTRGGSRVLDGSSPATKDAEAVRRLKAAGFIVLGRTNMTEFAFSGLGLNPHYGTPPNLWQEGGKRIPGGSSSGAAVSVARGMAHLALGTDTGGSCRIPAAFNGLVGYKPTAMRVPLAGALPLSSSLDSIGPIARSVQCCAIADAILSNSPEPEWSGSNLRGVRFVVPTNYVFDQMDNAVAIAFENALSRLSACGANFDRRYIEPFDRIPTINAKGGLTAAEAYASHRKMLNRAEGNYDPRVSERLRRGATQDAADYIEVLEARRLLVADASKVLNDVDGVVFPTSPIVPPRFLDVEDPTDFGRVNLLVLRNSTAINMIDGCAISIPIGDPNGAPVGITIAAPRGRDNRLLDVAYNVEKAIRAN